MLKTTAEYPCLDLHVSVPMGSETAAGCHPIIIRDDQQAMAVVCGFLVGPETEAVAAVEPTHFSGVSVSCGADDDRAEHGDSSWGGLSRVRGSALASGLDLEFDGDLVAEQHAVDAEGSVELDAEVAAQNLAAGVEAGAGGPVCIEGNAVIGQI